jgi:hypothetical protein
MPVCNRIVAVIQILSTVLSQSFLALLRSLSMVWSFIHVMAKWHREIYPDVYEICGIVR